MAKMSKEKMAQYQRDRRAKKAAAAVNPAQQSAVYPVNLVNLPVNPPPAVNPSAPAVCPDCESLRSDLAKEHAESARLKDIVKTLLNQTAEQTASLSRLRAESSRLRDELATLEDQQSDLSPVRPSGRPAARATTNHELAENAPGISFFKKTPPPAAPKDTEAEALRKRVIAAKVDRINNYAKGHAIGTARL
jgi:hypothetical protein